MTESSDISEKKEFGKLIWPFADQAGRPEVFEDPANIVLPDHFTHIKNFTHHKKGAGYLAQCKDHGVVVIAFQGTKQPTDWFIDLNFFKQSLFYKQVDLLHIWNYFRRIGIKEKVHSGFMKTYMELRSLIHDYLPTDNIKRYFVTGHSLGAALATLCTIDLRRMYKTPILIGTFGSPRVGNPEFVEYFNSLQLVESFRYVNDGDIICRIPFKEWGYKHVPTRITITKDGKFISGSASTEAFHNQMSLKLDQASEKTENQASSLADWYEELQEDLKDHYRKHYAKFLT